MAESVPDGDRLGFVILQKETAEVMLQSHGSAAADLTSLDAYCRAARCVLFVEVDDFGDLLKRLEGIEPAMPVRETFYGMTEIGVYEPGGNLIIFASPVKKSPE